MIQTLAKVLYSNKAILSLKSMRGWLILLLFLINTSLLSAPLMVNRAAVTGEDILAQFPGINQTLESIFNSSSCVIETQLRCDPIPEPTNMDGYEVRFFTQPQGSSYIYFAETAMVIQLGEVSFVGTYQFLEGQSFQTMIQTSSLEDVMYALATGSVGLDFFLIWFGQFLQNGMYFLIISLMLLISNYQTKREKLKYKEALAIAILAMIGPALFAGSIGIFDASLSGILFITIYSLRMMYLYFSLFTKNIN